MTVRETLTILFSTTIGFTLLGGVIGYSLGRFLPDYYRSVFIAGRFPDFDPLATGIGLGVTQGVTAGAVIGTLLIFILAWYRAKTNRVQDEQ